jgi:hypothetical protein
MKGKEMAYPHISVYCPETDESTFARFFGHAYFCANCGATDHEEENR